MNPRFKYILMPLMVGAVTFSCEQKDLDEISPNTITAESTGNATSANYIFNEGFEGSTAFSGRHTQFGMDYSFQMVSNPAYSGAKSGRFELRSSDGMVANGTRAEVIVADPATNKNRWYSFAAYFPAKDYAYDSGSEVISQWWQTSGSTQATSLRVRKDRLILRTGNNSSSLKEIDLGPVTKDSWQEYVFHFVHSYGSDGLIEVWRNGTKILNHTGGNMYNDKMPNWKIGIYKAAWNSGSTETTKRVIYYDNIRVGNENASLADMASTTAGTPTTAEPAPTAPEEPVTTEPAPTAPEEPVTTEPAPTAPEEPVSTEPAPTAPEEPVTTEPAPTAPEEPVSTEPAPTAPEEPVTTEPAPTAPEGPVTTEPAPTAPSTDKHHGDYNKGKHWGRDKKSDSKYSRHHKSRSHR